MNPQNRRKFLKFGLSSAGAMAFSSSITRAFAAACGLTPQQTAGPFYPGESKFTADNDLTFIPGRTERALGQVIYLSGKVLDENCQPVKDANIEIWQACANGRYNNEKDPNPNPIDPNFKYWGETFSNEKGEYSFKTIAPGAYPANATWMRPPHIHVRVMKLGFKELVTQVYFKGNQYNGADLILLDVPEAERSSVIVDFQPAPADPNSLLGEFNIALETVR
jgi:protocatechuate 3,4-dioxygenase beta subunit